MYNVKMDYMTQQCIMASILYVQVHQLIGYCPQFDAVLEDLTGYETLTMFCLLRGIPRAKSRHVINYLADELLFKKHLTKKVKEYRYNNIFHGIVSKLFIHSFICMSKILYKFRGTGYNINKIYEHINYKTY
jgi:hypothetical protein